MNVKEFESYDDYVALQVEKTKDPARRKKWIDNIEKNSALFKDTFLPYMDYISSPAICLGARTGEEVLSLQRLGIKAVGLDLVANPPLVIEGDVHNMDFEDCYAGFIYSNIVDHVLYPDKFIAECFRVLRKDGVLFLQLQVGSNLDKFGVYFLDSSDEFMQLFSGYKYETIALEPPKAKTPNNHALNFNVVLRKVN